MQHFLVKQVFQDFDIWFDRFKRNAPVRREYGSQSATVFRNPGDPHEVIIYFTCDSIETAMRFASDPRFMDTAEEIGSGIPLIITESFEVDG